MIRGSFASEAPKYWSRDFRIVPVEPGTKRPPLDMKGWQGALSASPSKQKRTAWLEQYPDHGVGLLLGIPLALDKVLVALDVDDDRLLKSVMHLLRLNKLEGSPVLAGKKGKKGATIFVRAPKTLKSTVIKGGGGLGNIDYLAAGKMTVMPPSIHPDTGKSYEEFGASLLEVDCDNLPEIGDQHIKLLKTVIGSEYASVVMSGKATHDAGVGLVGLLVHAGATDDEIGTIFVGLLPEGYSGNSLKEFPEWIKSARDKGFGEEDGEANSLTEELVNIALKSQMLLFNDGDDNAYAALPHLGGAVAVRLGSAAFSHWLRRLAYSMLERPVSSGPLREAVATLEAEALYGPSTFPVHTRVAGDEQMVAIDLGLMDGRFVQIDRSGWQIGQPASRKFVRGAGFEALPVPQAGGDLTRLRQFLGLDEHNYRLLIAFLLNALKPQGPYFILLVEGEQGSGKSFFCEVIKRIIDPNRALRLRLPDKPHDLMIQAKEYRLLNFDNASGMSAEMSDALCSLATGGGLAVRKLYSDGDLYVMNYSRPFVINGIGGYANRPDLMERAIPIKLPPMLEGGRKTEAELLAEFDQMLPGILDALYNAVSQILRVYDTTEPPRHLRMADAARWIKAAEEGLGEQAGSMIYAIATAQNEFVVERINDDPLVVALRKIIGPTPFEGYVGDLFGKIIELDDSRYQRSLPKSPSNLSNQLRRLRPAMVKAGIEMEFSGRDRKGSKVRIWFPIPFESGQDNTVT